MFFEGQTSNDESAKDLDDHPRSVQPTRLVHVLPFGLLAHTLRFGGWGGCEGGLATEPEDMGQEPSGARVEGIDALILGV